MSHNPLLPTTNFQTLSPFLSNMFNVITFFPSGSGVKINQNYASGIDEAVHGRRTFGGVFSEFRTLHDFSESSLIWRTTAALVFFSRQQSQRSNKLKLNVHKKFNCVSKIIFDLSCRSSGLQRFFHEDTKSPSEVTQSNVPTLMNHSFQHAAVSWIGIRYILNSEHKPQTDIQALRRARARAHAHTHTHAKHAQTSYVWKSNNCIQSSDRHR
jgi:hypothetical protein